MSCRILSDGLKPSIYIKQINNKRHSISDIALGFKKKEEEKKEEILLSMNISADGFNLYVGDHLLRDCSSKQEFSSYFIEYMTLATHTL